MDRSSTAAGSVADQCQNSVQFGLNALLIGGFVGGAVALASGGPLIVQLFVGSVVATGIAGGLYWTLQTLAATVTIETSTPHTHVSQTETTREPPETLEDRSTSTHTQ